MPVEGHLARPCIDVGKPSVGRLRFVSFRIHSFLQELMLVGNPRNAINDFLDILNDIERGNIIAMLFQLISVCHLLVLDPPSA